MGAFSFESANRKITSHVLSILLIVILALAGCGQQDEYLSFIDQKGQGPDVFQMDRDTCESYASLHSRKSEGSQGAGERYNLQSKLYKSCMKGRNWLSKE